MPKANSNPSNSFSDKNKAIQLQRNIQNGRLRAYPMGPDLLKVEVFLDGQTKSGLLILPTSAWENEEILLQAVERLIQLRAAPGESVSVYAIERRRNGKVR